MMAQSARVLSPRVMAVFVGVSVVLSLLGISESARAQGEIRSFPSRLVVGREALSDLVEVRAGLDHHLAIKSSGEVVGWGGGAEVCVPPAPNEGFIAVATSYAGSYGLKSDGTIVGWPAHYAGLPEPNEEFVAMDAGEQHALALRADGSVVAWGSGLWGLDDVPAPNSGFAAVSAGNRHNLGLKVNGSVVAWGSNSDGQCEVPLRSGFVAVSAGRAHNLGLLSDGSIIAWGRNEEGQCDVPSPNTGFIAIAAGGRHSLGLKADGTIVAWGDDGNGQCEISHTNLPVVKISARDDYSIALLSDGTILEWGCFGVEGFYCHRGASADYTGFVKLAIGPSQIVGLHGDGTLDWWGALVVPLFHEPPQEPAPLPTVDLIDISASSVFCVDWDCWEFGLGVTRQGSIVGWGSWDSTWVPQPNLGFVSTAPGIVHALALREDGSIAAWGDNQLGECDVPEPNSGFVSIAAAGHRSAALRANGMVEVWGASPLLPQPNGGFVALAMSDRHFLGLREDGSILAWGGYPQGECGACNVPAPNTGFVAVSAGSSGWGGGIPGCAWSCGLKEDGTVVTWGWTNDAPNPNSGYVAVRTRDGCFSPGEAFRPGAIGLWDPAGFVADAGDRRGDPSAGAGRSGLELTGLPNPFAPSLRLRYRLAATSNVRLTVFDVGGRQVREFALGARGAGEGSVRWDGRDDEGRNVPAGVYLARITDGNSEASCRVTLVR